MLDRITIYKVNDVTFVATGPIPQTCTTGISQATPDGFKSVYTSTHSIKPTPEREILTRGRSVEAKRASGGDAPARTPEELAASGSDAPARGTLPVSRLHTPTPERTTHYFSKCISCSRSWGSHDHKDGCCPICSRTLVIFEGKIVMPPDTPESLVPEGIVRGTGTPPPPPASGGNAPARGSGGSVPFPLAPLERALSGPYTAREPSRSKPRDEQGSVGSAPTKARTVSPNITSTPSRDVIMRDAANPPRERWGEVRKLTRHDSPHCGNCHGLSPLGSRECGFCRFAFLSPRVPTHRVPHVVPSGLGRDMNRSPTRGHVEPKRGHTRSDQGQERQYAKRNVRHAYRWDNEPGYRIE